MRPALIPASLAAGALLLTGCTSGAIEPDIAAPQPDAATTPTDLTEYLSQTVDFEPCPTSDSYLDTIPEDALCGSVRVPIDYFDNDSERGYLSVALIKIPAIGDSAGNLLINPGGPGGSGFDFVANNADSMRRNLPGYDLIGFDPRGVQRSYAFDCKQGTEARLDLIEMDFSAEDKEEYEQNLAFAQEYEQACRDAYPAWGFLGTASVARDMYVISKALGDEKTNYFGVSYGSELGYEFLRTFPQDVGRMILESPVDPAVEEVLADQLAAFNDQLETRLAQCAAQEWCGLGRSAEEVRAEFIAALADIENPKYQTLTDNDQPSERLVYYGLILPLYWEENPEYTQWYLEAIGALINDDNARAFEYWGYLYEGYEPDQNRFTGGDDILPIVRCLDESTPPDELDLAEEKAKDEAELAQIAQRAPILSALGFSDFYQDDRSYEACTFAKAAFGDPSIPDPPAEAAPVTNPGGNPVLLIGITGDTATPYEWSQTIAANLGVPLVTHDTTGHAVYTTSQNQCLRDVVTIYLSTGQTPAAPITC